MSCWVVPAVAAEYWGVTIDVVWDRIHADLVPHKTERGFVFIDVDPWRVESSGLYPHEPPATFVPAASTPDFFAPALSTMLLCEPKLDEAEQAFLADEPLSDDEAFLFVHESQGPLAIAENSSEEQDADGLSDELDEGEADGDDELPPLDEEESATFGRLSWQEVRQTVGRTRRPPPRAA